MNQLHLIVKVFQHFKGLLVPASGRFEGYLAEMGGRFSFLSNELQEDDIFLHVYACVQRYGLPSWLHVLVLFQSPHVYNGSRVVMVVLASRVHLNVFQSALSEAIGGC